MYAAPKPAYPIITSDILKSYDAFLFGIPTRYGNFPAQWKAFIDTTGGLWASGSLSGKYAGLFVSTGGQGGGQEVTALNSMSTLVHHGIIYVPFGYKHAFPLLSSVAEVRGGSPWGAGTFAVRFPVSTIYFPNPHITNGNLGCRRISHSLQGGARDCHHPGQVFLRDCRQGQLRLTTWYLRTTKCRHRRSKNYKKEGRNEERQI